MPDIVWSPAGGAHEASSMWRFAERAGIDPRDAEALHRWSISDLGGFWGLLWDFAGLIGEKGAEAFRPDPQYWMTGAQFFPEARLNLAENLLRQDGDMVIVVERDESGGRRAWTAAALRAEVARVVEGLRGLGVGPGDRVATVLPNRVEALVTLLATVSLGAVWTSCSPDFGTAAILDRVGQVTPKVLFTCGRVRYGGKDVDIVARMAEVADGIDSLVATVCVGEVAVAARRDVLSYADFGNAAPLAFTPMPFDAPAYILYTSGTTGKPKAIVHRAGGMLLQLVKEHLLHGDVRPGDRLLWYSNTAWMMYHWMVGALACDATIVLYDGAPVVKTPAGLDCGPLWRAVEEERLTHLGISPKYLSLLQDEGFVSRDQVDTGSLRWLLSAGSPVAPWQFDWIFASVAAAGGEMGFASISGGTEIMGCFLLGHPGQPVRRGALTTKGLGMAVAVLDDRGVPVIGRAGELCCTEPFPSMPLTFWGEGGTDRYHGTYFADRREIWTHGDQATLNADGSAVIHGRSDFTLNPGGVRIGTADIYNVCDRMAEIADCIVFGRPVPGDEEIVLCLQMTEGCTVDAALAKRIRQELRAQCSPRHVPTAIYTVAGIPYTINGKRVEGAAKASASGQQVRNLASLANPDCLAEYEALQGRTAL